MFTDSSHRKRGLFRVDTLESHPKVQPKSRCLASKTCSAPRSIHEEPLQKALPGVLQAVSKATSKRYTHPLRTDEAMYPVEHEPVLFGCQQCTGSKSTFSDLLATILEKWAKRLWFAHRRFYLTREAREQLAQTIHPFPPPRRPGNP